MDLELTDLRRDPQSGVMNAKSVKEANAMERVKEQGLVDNYRRPKLYLGEPDSDFVSFDGTKKYDIKSVVQHKFKTYQNSAEDIVKNIIDQSKEYQGNNIPHYYVDLKDVPNFLQSDIAQYMQNQFQNAPSVNLDKIDFLFN